MIIYIVTVAAYDITGASAETLYFSTKGFSSLPTDTPANTFFDERLKAPASIARNMFSQGRTFGPSQVGLGEVTLANGDGALDYLSDYAFDGRVITQYRGEEGSAFPGGYTKQLVATMDQVVLNRNEVSITLRDRQQEVDVPIQSTLYAGNNSLPAGLEGVGDLKGKPKPLLYGVVKNIPAPMVNSTKLIYQVNDGAVATIDEVYDRGIKLKKTPFSWDAVSVTTTHTIRDFAYSPSLDIWVAVGGKSASPNHIFMTSADNGATWTERTSAFGAATVVYAVIWATELNLFVAAGQVIVGTAGVNTSPDGITWTNRTTGFDSSSGNGYGLAFDGTTLVAVAGDGQIETSTNGTAWTTRTSGTSAIISCVHWARGLFVAGTHATEIFTSPDGTTWTETLLHSMTDEIRSVTYGRDRWVIVGELDTLVSYSKDGLAWSLGNNWSEIDPASPTYPYTDRVKYSEVLGLFVISYTDARVRAADSFITMSVDGITWENMGSALGGSVDTAYGIGVNDTTVLLGGKRGTLSKAATGAVYSSEANLLNDDNAPSPGTFRPYLTGGYFRLGSPPSGLITADVTQGAAASDRTTGQIFTDVLVKVGLASADWVSGDITTLDSAIDDVVGYWSATTVDQASRVLNVLVEAIGWWGVNSLGIFRIAELKNPSGETSVLDIVKADMIRPLSRSPTSDPGLGIPSYNTRIRYGLNYAIQSSDLAAGVSDERRTDVSQEWKEETDLAAAVKTAHLLAREEIYHTYLSESADANTAAARVQSLRGTRRDIFDFSISYNSATAPLDLGSIIKITHDRFGLSSGKKFVIISYQLNPVGDAINIGAWG